MEHIQFGPQTKVQKKKTRKKRKKTERKKKCLFPSATAKK